MSNAYYEPFIGLILSVVLGGGAPQITIINHKQNLVLQKGYGQHLN